MLTAAVLRASVEYELETGEFFRRSNGQRTGAFWDNSRRYMGVYIGRKKYKAHRLAWLYVYGAWPLGQIDHINGDRIDNRIENLRDVPAVVNAQNRRRAQKNSATGLLGVKPSKWGFEAYITVRGMKKYLGCFRTAAEAHEAYVAAKRVLHPGCTI